jgi:hypothetical protein
MKLLLENWRQYLTESYYHITRSENVPLIMKGGLTPSKPDDMQDAKGVYLFKSIIEAEDALMNWLGERFGEEEKLTLLKVDPRGVGEVDSSAAGFEVTSMSKINPKWITPVKEYI